MEHIRMVDDHGNEISCRLTNCRRYVAGKVPRELRPTQVVLYLDSAKDAEQVLQFLYGTVLGQPMPWLRSKGRKMKSNDRVSSRPT